MGRLHDPQGDGSVWVAAPAGLVGQAHDQAQRRQDLAEQQGRALLAFLAVQPVLDLAAQQSAHGRQHRADRHAQQRPRFRIHVQHAPLSPGPRCSPAQWAPPRAATQAPDAHRLSLVVADRPGSAFAASAAAFQPKGDRMDLVAQPELSRPEALAKLIVGRSSCWAS